MPTIHFTLAWALGIMRVSTDFVAGLSAVRIRSRTLRREMRLGVANIERNSRIVYIIFVIVDL
jgi:hypothetical protein